MDDIVDLFDVDGVHGWGRVLSCEVCCDEQIRIDTEYAKEEEGSEEEAGGEEEGEAPPA